MKLINIVIKPGNPKLYGLLESITPQKRKHYIYLSLNDVVHIFPYDK